MENNRELNEMIFQNYGELYDAMLNYLRENCLVTHFPIQGDRYDEQSNKLLLVGRSLNGWGCKDEYSGAFQYEKAPARDDYVEKHTVHCLQNTDMDLSRKTGSNTTMIRLQEVHSGEPRN